MNASNKEIILITDPRILAIPIEDCNEPLIDLKNQSIIAVNLPDKTKPNYYINNNYTKIRKTVYEMLIKAQLLLPENLKFCLDEGYRSLSIQEQLFKKCYLQQQILYTDWSSDSIFKETTKFVSPIINLDCSSNVPPHSTGAAIDVHLIDDNQQALDMGMPLEENFNKQYELFAQTDSQKISVIAQKNRKIMSNALLKAGFVNYPTEYWHWSYGDRYWAYHKRFSHAIYGQLPDN